MNVSKRCRGYFCFQIFHKEYLTAAFQLDLRRVKSNLFTDISHSMTLMCGCKNVASQTLCHFSGNIIPIYLFIIIIICVTKY